MKRYVSLVIFLALFHSILAQKDKEITIMTIGNENISKAEFERIFKKNNQNKEINRESLDEYLELFINFKLKVLEAESLGMDTSKAFLRELAGYRKQLSKPYLIDEKVVETLAKEAYERMKYEIEASHILVKINPNADPQDTLIALAKIKKIRKRLLKGEDFEKVAKETSEDPSVKNNGGYLNYITVFQTVYPFENALYKLRKGELSKPVRTRFGYHLVKIHDKKPYSGKRKVAHIMIVTPKGSTQEQMRVAKDTIDMIYAKVKRGEDFGELAKKYSIDKSSAQKGGVLPWFSRGRMIKSFEEAAFALQKINEVSEPIKTPYGWHIIKLIDKKGLEKFDDIHDEIKTKVSRDGRADIGRGAVIEKLKKNYSYKMLGNLERFYQVVDNSIFEGAWAPHKAYKLQETLFTLGNKKYNEQEFVKFIASKKRQKALPIKQFIDMKYEQFVADRVMAYEDEQLEKKYPEFFYLMKEYHDGILLFDLTDKLVWSKAVNDTIGLEKYYKANMNKYMWGNRIKATVFAYNNNSIKRKLEKILAKKERKKLSDKDVLKYFNKKEKMLLIEKNGIFAQGDNPMIDKIYKGMKSGQISKNAKSVFFDKEKKVVYIEKKIAPEPKTLNEAKGLVTADYQTYLEKAWIKKLREKYKINVNKSVLYSIK